MLARPEVKFTIREYQSLPETGPRYELIDGELILMSPAPPPRHQKFVGKLFRRLDEHVERGGLGTVWIAPLDVYLSRHDCVQPDILFVSNEREYLMAPDGLHGSPDLAVEILSPSTRARDLGAKRALYARHGVIEFWAVDLESATIAVYALAENPSDPARVLSRADRLESKLLPGLSIPLAELPF